MRALLRRVRVLECWPVLAGLDLASNPDYHNRASRLPVVQHVAEPSPNHDGSPFSLERINTGFTGADTNGLFKRRDKDLNRSLLLIHHSCYKSQNIIMAAIKKFRKKFAIL